MDRETQKLSASLVVPAWISTGPNILKVTELGSTECLELCFFPLRVAQTEPKMPIIVYVFQVLYQLPKAPVCVHLDLGSNRFDRNGLN